MPLHRDSLRSAGHTYQAQRARSLTEAKSFGMRTGFLCHSHKDRDYVKGFIALLKQQGIDLYVDWEDAELPEKPDRTTALRIQERIVQAKYFIFLATPNSVTSRWCPWEIGYANGMKDIDTLLVVPTTDASGQTAGNEYLDLYRRIDEFAGSLRFFEPRKVLGESLKNL